MRRALRLAIAGGLAVAITLLIGWLSQIPYAAESTDQALIRLSWRARGERIESCRRPTEEEQRQIPQHMRQEEICEGRIAPYRLQVDVDGLTALVDTIHASGARQDRPLFVYGEVRVPPGSHDIHVEFVRLGERPPASTTPDASAPPKLSLNASIHPKPGDVVLVTYEGAGADLVLRNGAPTRPQPAP